MINCSNFLRKYWKWLFIFLIYLIIQSFLIYSFFEYENTIKFKNLTEFSEKIKIKSIDLHKKSDFKSLNKSDDQYCKLEDEYLQSAIQRAKSNHCKNEIKNTFCLHQTNQLYLNNEIHILNSCPNEILFKPNGCYLNNQNPSSIDSIVFEYKKINELKCSYLCTQLNRKYFGMENSKFCHCLNSLPLKVFQINESLCNQYCDNKTKQYRCGSEYLISIYETGIDDDINRKNDIRLAFIFSVNGRSIRQIKRLIKQLYDKKHYYLIHVDKQNDFLFNYLNDELSSIDNIIITNERYYTIWGNYSGSQLLEMLLNSIKILIKFKWDYIINLSETDYPIKSLASLENYLKKFKDKNFLKFHGQYNDIFIRKQGLEILFLQCENRMWRLNKKRNLIEQIEFTGGSDWFSLHFTFANYLVNNIFNDTINSINYSVNNELTNNDQQFVNNLRIFFNYTLLPAESFFHTVLRNSKYCSKLIVNNLRLTNWKRKIGCKCQYRHVVDFCGCSPNVYLKTDILKLKSTINKPLFFARKFDPLIDHNIINQNELLYNPKSIELINFNKYWHVEYNYKYDKQDRNLIRSTFTYLSSLALDDLFSRYSNYFQIKSSNILNQIIEINTFLNNDNYIGTQTVLNFTYFNRFKFINLKLEFLVSSNHILKSYNDIENNLPVKLVYLKVCSDYDIKEDLFRNFGCLMNTESQLIVQHKWLNLNKLINNYTINFIWINSNEKIAFKDSIIMSNMNSNNRNEMITSLNFKSTKLDKSMRPGVWRLIIGVVRNSREINSQENIVKLNLDKIFSKLILNNKIIGETNFLVLDNQKNKINSPINPMNQLKQFWSLKDVCLSSDQKYFNELINLISINRLNFTIKNCLNTSWSSNLFDPKSIFVN